MGAIITNLRDGEVRRFAGHGQATLGHSGAMAMLLGEFEPGWRWSVDIAPLAGTTSCRTRHLGYVISGQMQIAMDDGSEISIGPGDLFDLPAGHDAWVVGDEKAVLIDVSADATRYASRGTAAATATAVDPYVDLVRLGYEAFNSGDVAGLQALLSRDVQQHVPGNSQISGEYKGLDAVLAYYGRLGELTDGTMRADLIEAHGDGRGHVLAVHPLSATRNGATRVSRGSILFTFLGEKATDLLELSQDQAGDDAFFA